MIKYAKTDNLFFCAEKRAAGLTDVELNEEGIRKITSLFGDKAEKAIDKIQNLLDAGSSYKSFGGISKDMDGQVKFIYKTPEIGERE